MSADGAGPAPLIRLRGVQKFFGEYHALRDVDLDIREGEFFSLLGPSGCGKTTLLRTIAGFEAPSAGTLTIGGQDMARVPPNRRPTNMVFQSYAIFPHLTVEQNVAFGLRRRRDLNTAARREMVADALDMVGLDGFGARASHALSGGQRQRVALARALVLRPKVLLLDEPLSALDRKMREQMQVELMRLQRHVGITFILVTHDQEEALVMSDRIAVMFEGAIAQLADAESLYRRPADRRVAEFIGSMNFLPARVLTEGPGGVEVEAAGLGRMTLAAGQCGPVTGGEAVLGLRPEVATLLFGDQPSPDREAAGTIAEVVYYGDMTYYDVALDGAEQPMRVAMRNVFGREVPDVGARARLAWSPGAVLLFR